MTDLGTFVAQTDTGFKWYVLSDYNDVVLAQGVTKTSKTAQKHAEQARAAFLQDLAA